MRCRAGHGRNKIGELRALRVHYPGWDLIVITCWTVKGEKTVCKGLSVPKYLGWSQHLPHCIHTAPQRQCIELDPCRQTYHRRNYPSTSLDRRPSLPVGVVCVVVVCVQVHETRARCKYAMLASTFLTTAHANRQVAQRHVPVASHIGLCKDVVANQTPTLSHV